MNIERNKETWDQLWEDSGGRVENEYEGPRELISGMKKRGANCQALTS
jgi:hypothetical protein